MKRIVTHGEHRGEIDWRQQEGDLEFGLSWGSEVRQDGAAHLLEVEPGIYSVLLNGRSYEAKIVPSGSGWAVDVDGRRFLLEVSDPREARGNGAGLQQHGQVRLAAPMPGRVVRLLAAEGDEIAAGQGIAVVEAMKMQNEVKAPRAGRIISLHAREGVIVAAGEVLAVIE